MQSFLNFYSRYILNKPIIVIIVLLGLFTYLGFHSRDFRLDASADSLILENDQDLKYFRETNKKYGTASYLLMTYKPRGDLFYPETLRNLGSLRDELKEIKRVSSVFTILDVPLLRNPPVHIKELMANIKDLEDPAVDLQLAQIELGNSPIYQELLISSDLKMTALVINLADDLVAGRKFKTIYFGGGTPSLASTKSIKHILDSIKNRFSSTESEITIEMNPSDVSEDRVDELLIAGINRISLGIQSYNNQELQALGRNHDRESAIKATQALQGINSTIDLIYGIEKQTPRSFTENIY